MRAMNKLVVILIFCLIGCKGVKTIEISHTTYDHYFVKNSYPVDSAGNYLQIQDTALFNNVFGLAATMDKISIIQPDDFNDKFVIAVIKDFKNNKYNFRIVKVSKVDNDIRVDYEFNLEEKGLSYSTTGNCVIQIKKQSCKWIKFYENGKFIKQISMTDYK
jgi:hypothetical protein